MKPMSTVFLLVLMLLGSGCAILDQFIDPPVVSITDIRALPAQGLQPRFAVHLNILNPNPIEIPVTGMAYDISLNGYALFSGATSDVPSIPHYEEVALQVEVGANLLQAVGFVTELVRGDLESVDYVIASDIKVRGYMQPISVTESGVVNFNSAGN